MEENIKKSFEIVKNNELISLIEVDSFNSDIFNLKMFNVYVYNEGVDVSNIIDLAFKNDINHLSVKISTSNKTLLHKFEENGFKLMDTLVTYRFEYSKKVLINMEHQCILRDAQKDDLKTMMDFAGNSFKIDRFHSDPSLDKSAADRYYSKWIENSVNGLSDRVIVAEINNEVVGFTTCKLPSYQSQVGRMILSAVSEKSRGKGIYTSMIHEGLMWMKDKCNYLEVGTQIDNYPVQKTWVNLGMFLVESFYVLHKRIK